MPSKLNEYMFEEMQSRFGELNDCFVVQFEGVTSAEMTTLRTAVRKENGQLTVIKNSIARKAFEALGKDKTFTSLLDGPVALAYGEDPATIVKAVSDWNKKAKKLSFQGGLLGGRQIAAADVGVLAALPPLPVMQAMAIGSIAAPLTSLLGMCNEVMRSFLRVVDQLARKEESKEA